LRILLKTLLYVTLSVVVLVVAISLFTQTGLFRSLAKDKALGIINEFLNATLSVESLEGNFYSSLELKNGKLAFGDTSVVEFESLKLSYDAFAVFRDQVQVNEVRLVRPKIYVKADSSGVLNLARVAKPSEGPKVPKPIDSNATMLAGFNMRLDKLAIDDGFVDVSMPAAKVQITNLNIDLQAQANDQLQNLALNQLSFNVIRPSGKSKTRFDTLRVKNLSLITGGHFLPPSLKERAKRIGKKDSLELKIDEIRLVTDRTDFFLKGKILMPDSLQGIDLAYNVDVRAYPISLDEIRRLAPIGMNDIHKIELEAHADGNSQSAYLTDLKLLTSAGNLRGRANVQFAKEPLNYECDLRFNGVNIGAFANRNDLNASINGQFYAKGSGKDIHTLQTSARLSLVKSQVYGVDIDTFKILAEVKNDKAELKKFEGQTSAGYFNCEGWYNLSSEQYHLETKLRAIDIGDVMGNVNFSSDINLKLVYDGQGLNPKTSSSSVSVVSDRSVIMNRKLENLTVRGSKKSNKVYVEELTVVTPLASLSASGAMGLDSTVDLKYRFKTLDLSLLKKYIGNDTLFKDSLDMKLDFKGEVTGGFKQLRTSGQLTMTKFIFSKFKIDSLFFSYAFDDIHPNAFEKGFDFKAMDQSVYGDVFLYTRNADLAGTAMRDFTTSITKEKGKTSFEVSGIQDTLDAYVNVKGSVVLENEKKGELVLDNLYLKIAGRSIKTKEVSVKLGGDPIIDTTYERWSETWQNSRPMDVAFDANKNVYDIRSFNMDIGKGFISLFGTLDINGDQNLDLKFKDLDLSRANAVIGSNQSVIEGLLNLNASLKGSFEKPIIIADWNISQGKASEFTYNNFLGNIQYLNKKLQLNMTLNQNSDKTLTIGGAFPIDLTFKDVPQRFTARPMNCKIHSEGIDLRFLQAFFGRQLTLNRGEIKVDLTVSGNKEKPKLEGEMKIEDGTVTFPRNTMGQSFRNMRMFVRLTPEAIYLDTLSMQSGKDPESNLFASGDVNLSDVLKNFAFENVDKIGYMMNLKFNNFVPINTKSETSYLQTAKISGNMEISAKSLAYTSVKGDLQIRNSEIWVVDPTKAKTVTSVPAKKSKGQKEEINYYKNLDLDLNIDLPDNANNAIRSAEMTLNLQGSIGVSKPSGAEDFFITGDVNTKPGGKYTYLNAAFTISQGAVTFSGEPGVNPDLNITAIKRFEYTNEDKQVIPAEAQIKVTGKLLKPEIAITAVERGSDTPIDGLTEPADILSYVVLGVKTSDLTKLGGSQVNDFAKQLAINQLLTQVANKAGLQKLEYQTGAEGQSSSIAVSKRINETISVSYEGGFDAASERNLTLEVAADSLVKIFKTWKKTVEFEYKKPAQEKNAPDIFNVLFYFRKDY